MAISLPSLPKLPTRLPGVSLLPAAVLNVVSMIASNLPKINPPRPIYAIINADTGVPLTVPDSWLEVTPRFSEFQVSDYPVEGGAFAAYNKVRRPDSVDMVLVKTGPDLARATWLEAIRQQVASDPIARYHIITPNGVFQSLTINRQAFQARQDRGSNMLYLELQFSEVPQITALSLIGDNAVDPESRPTNELGRVYPSDTSPQIIELAKAGAPSGTPLTGA